MMTKKEWASLPREDKDMIFEMEEKEMRDKGIDTEKLSFRLLGEMISNAEKRVDPSSV